MYPSYVYTKSAAKGRLKRGAKSVLVFQPYTGLLIKVTEKNFSKIFKTTLKDAR